MDLQEARAVIDELDLEITQLLEKRLEVVKDVALYKQAHGMEIYQKNREDAVYEKVTSYLKNKNHQKRLRNIYQAMMAASKDYQAEVLEQDKK